MSLEAETGVVGSMLLDGVRLETLCRNFRLRPAWFEDPAARLVVEAVYELWDRKVPVDLFSVSDAMRRTGKLDSVGGVQWLEHVVDSTPTSAHAEYYLTVVRQDSLRKCFKGELRHLSQQVEESAPELLVQTAGEAFRRLIKDHACATESNAGQVYDQLLATWRKAKEDQKAGKQPEIGVRLPWWELTKLLGGLKPGLHILAARPSAGKTTMEGNIRICAAMAGARTLTLECDMSAEGLLARDLCRLAGVSYRKLNFGYAREDQIAMVEEVGKKLRTLGMEFIFGQTSIEMLAARARAMKAQGGLELITADYGQRLTYDGWERHEMVARSERITGMLKDLALELEVPLLCLAQLRRPDPGMRKDFLPPNLEEILGGTPWEANAYSVGLLYQDEKVWGQWMKRAKEEWEAAGGRKKWREFKPKQRPVVWRQAKHQNGELGEVNFLLRPAYFTFVAANENFEEVEDSGADIHDTDED